jgi:hypothetical protein
MAVGHIRAPGRSGWRDPGPDGPVRAARHPHPALPTLACASGTSEGGLSQARLTAPTAGREPGRGGGHARIQRPGHRYERGASVGGHGRQEVSLGLAIVDRIVRRHGGVVAIEESPLGGARVATTWPRLFPE